ncbi:MAG: hypothetical protein HFE72_10400 [Emergencia sp.]|uniref:hypothetical protein n=1 Tax=Senimuribacter intestinalis TaxID=2941507 RepID=UPI00203EAA53|nr:hypothetical protein [Senimuribacter intestinalis]MCI9640510.1 hypothetical protein [Emergencia sp.]
MTKQELSRHFWLQHEVKRQEKRLARLRKKQQLIREQGEVGDTVRDYKTGKGIPVRIEGVPEEEFTLPLMIKLLEEEIEKNIKESQAEAVKIERYIQTIENPKIRELMRSRFLDCMSWEEVAEANFVAKDYARSLIREFINNV